MSGLRRAVKIFVAAMIVGNGFAYAEVRCPLDTRLDDLATRFRIGGTSIQMPIGAFLLIRKNGQIGAIRLTDIDRKATEYLGKSTYESFFPADHSGLFRSGSSDIIRQGGLLEIKPVGGLIRGFAYQPGPYSAHIGKWSFPFSSPGRIGMSSYHRNDDQGYEFAPTSACDLSEIDATDSRLRWFRYDPRASIVLPLADLPK
jgi:hypothetical protein